MTINFQDHLQTSVGEIERPPQPPIGSYRFQITKIPAYETSGNGEYDIVNFTVKAVEALEDVDGEELEKYGPVTNIGLRLSFLFDKNDETRFKQSLHKLRRFLENDLKIASEDMALNEALSQAVNQQFIGAVGWRPDRNDAEIQYAEIRKTAPVE